MTHNAVPPRLHRAAVGRADLLRALQSSDSHVSTLFGFQRLVTAKGHVVKELVTDGLSVTSDVFGMLEVRHVPVETRAPLRAIHYQIEQRALEAATASLGARPPVVPLKSLPEADRTIAAPEPRTLVSKARLADFARRHLRRPSPSAVLDLEAWIARIAHGQTPTRLPTKRLRQWGATSALIINAYGDSEPIRADLDALLVLVWRRSAGMTPIYLHSPDGDLFQLKRGGKQRRWRPCARAKPQQHAHWLWAGADLQGAQPDEWPQAMLAKQRGAGDVVWLQLGLGAGMPALSKLRIVPWDIGSKLRASRAHQGAPVDVPGLDRLIAAMSMAIRIEPSLLRELRLLLNLSMAAEYAAWQHEDVLRSAIACWLHPHEVARWRAVATQLPETLRSKIAQLIAQQHLHLSPLIQAEEAALSSALAPGSRSDADQTVWQEIAMTLRQPDHPLAEDCARYVRRLGTRAHPDFWRQNETVAEAWLLSEKISLQAGAELPEGIPGALAARVLDEGSALPCTEWSLLQNQAGQNHASLRLQPGRQRTALSLLELGGTQVQLEHGAIRRRLHLQGETELGDANVPMQIWLPEQLTRIIAVPRPSWAHEFGRDQGGVYALGGPLGANQFKRYALASERAASENPFFLPEAIGYAMEWPVAHAIWRLGIDLEFGNFADLRVGKAVQRFRWIEPGEFLMGSPDDEPERFDDEGPQHRVRISEGFWLADTACTQALWLAVMGAENPSHNPSYFNGDTKLPVEQVSFDDVETFLECLQALLPEHVAAGLPSEAQWEYAGRAGTTTPFSFGASIHSEQVNFDGNHPYNGSEASEQRGRTVPVKSLPANSWGLFEMHGNVWEWCRDGQRTYQATGPGQVELDPLGTLGPAARALRGGAWFDFAWYARCAYRVQLARGDRRHGVGFRFSLRSLSPAGPEGRSSKLGPEAPKARRDVEPRQNLQQGKP